MKVTIWGCRGSLATPGPLTVKYGGNTSCVEVRLKDGTPVILDAGTGIRPLGLKLSAESPDVVHVLLTHLHLDHIEGLGFFLPLWDSRMEIHIWGPCSTITSLQERLARYLSPPLFPLQLSEAASRLFFHDVPEGTWNIGDALLASLPVEHPGPTVGYTIAENGRSLAYIPDHEPALGKVLHTSPPEWISGYGLAQGVDVLLHDAQYTEEEYSVKIGWGHSSVDDAVSLAAISDVDQLVMFHHDPSHSDEQLEQMMQRASRRWSGAGEKPTLAWEGMTIELS